LDVFLRYRARIVRQSGSQCDAHALKLSPWITIGLRLEQSFDLVPLAAMYTDHLILSHFPKPLEEMPKNVKVHLSMVFCYFIVIGVPGHGGYL
jgi:hypothetical protein